MKKNFFIIIISFGLLLSLNAESLALQIDMPLTNVKSIYGNEQTTYIAEPYPKEDWDLICYHYDYFDIYAYRCQSTVNRIYIYADKYIGLIDNYYIHCGQTKNDIEKVFGSGSYEGKDKKGNDK